MKRVALILITVLVSCTCHAQSNEKDQLLGIVAQFFDGLRAKDTTLLNEIVHPDAHSFYITEREGAVRTSGAAIRAFNKRLIASSEVWNEKARTVGARVEIHERIATAWVPYDFWVDKAFSHCGIDVFTFVKTDAGWKIVSIVYSIETKGCE